MLDIQFRGDEYDGSGDADVNGADPDIDEMDTWLVEQFRRRFASSRDADEPE